MNMHVCIGCNCVCVRVCVCVCVGMQAFHSTCVCVCVFNVPRLRQANVLVHFHSVSCDGSDPSLDKTGTQPPNVYNLFLMRTAVCKLRGRGAGPCVVIAFHSILSIRIKTCGHMIVT